MREQSNRGHVMKRLLLTMVMITFLASSAAFAAGVHPDTWYKVSDLTNMYEAIDLNGNYLMNPGSYWLEKDIETGHTLVVPSGKTVTICLHGHVLKNTSNINSIIHLDGDATLNIQDCSANGKILNEGASPYYFAVSSSGGTVNLLSGTISASNGIYGNGGTINLSGGMINATRDGVAMDGGVVELSGSPEIGAKRYGIYAGNNALLKMKSGIITADGEDSAGIRLENGKAEISDGKAEGKKYGINATAGSTVEVTRGFITATADINPRGIDMEGGSLKITDGYVKGLIKTSETALAVRGGKFDYNPDHLLAIEYLTVGSGVPSYPYQVVERPKRTVTFTDGAGNTISTQSVYLLTDAAAPKDPVRDGYKFTGWDKPFTNVTTDLTVNALWEKVEASGTDGEAAGTAKEQDREKITIGTAPKLLKVKAKRNKVTVTWKKIRKNKKGKKLLKQIKRIEVQCSTDPAFPKETTVTKKVRKNKTKAVLKLQRKKTYYVRVRYKGSNGVSKWSRVKQIKTK